MSSWQIIREYDISARPVQRTIDTIINTSVIKRAQKQIIVNNHQNNKFFFDNTVFRQKDVSGTLAS